MRLALLSGLPPAPADRPTTPAPAPEELGAQIGRYKLLQKIGEGGCGTVYMAEQEEPVRRRVALKVIKLGMDTKQVVARFEAEGQALAMMDHPNIAKIFDAGVVGSAESQISNRKSPIPGGRPYFVMELVRGVRITQYCDQHKLSTAERLDLFIQVCQAIQHAHQKGIIHRDIKPSNVLRIIREVEPAKPSTRLTQELAAFGERGKVGKWEMPHRRQSILTHPLSHLLTFDLARTAILTNSSALSLRCAAIWTGS
jgi:serine/threonine protein kinase